MKKRFGLKLLALLLVAASLLGCLTTAFAASKKQSKVKTEQLIVYAADYPVEEDGWYSTMEEVAVYLTLYEKLPGNFISKYDAEDMGWDNRKGNLDKVAPGTANEDTLLYGVEVKFYNMEVAVNEHLQTKYDGLYVIGDGSGITHSLSHASASGVFVARDIINN